MPQGMTVFVIYETPAGAETAVDNLIREHFPSNDISVLLPDNLPETNAIAAGRLNLHEVDPPGAGSHHVLGGTLGVLAGLSMLAIPGLGPLVGEGTLKAGLAGLGVKNAIGRVAQALIRMGVPELEAKRYEDRLHQRTILMSVRCASPEAAARAVEILKRNGGQDVCISTRDSAVDVSHRTRQETD
ncbi:MAG TPA: hypothetical protein VIW23_17760 [Candidatus Acidoferrum sp.]